MTRRTRALTGSVLLAAHALTGCTSWRVTSVQPQELLTQGRFKAIQVREQSGATYVLLDPRLVGDSLAGYLMAQSPDGGRSRTETQGVAHRIPLAAIAQVGVAKFNPLKSVGALVIVGAFGTVIIGLVVWAGLSQMAPCCFGSR